MAWPSSLTYQDPVLLKYRVSAPVEKEKEKEEGGTKPPTEYQLFPRGSQG